MFCCRKCRRYKIFHSSGLVVIAEIVGNITNFVFKIVGWQLANSHSMFAETLHSLADTTNQILLAFGIMQSTRKPTLGHPYGYSSMEFIMALMAGVGIFCIGSGLSIFRGIYGFFDNHELEDVTWAYISLGVSAAIDGSTLVCSSVTLLRRCIKNRVSPIRYVYETRDPSLNVVLFEDSISIAGLLTAAIALALNDALGWHYTDQIGSIVIGILIAISAGFIIKSNTDVLIGRSVDKEIVRDLKEEILTDGVIKKVVDCKAIEISGAEFRYKAEIAFDAQVLAKIYLQEYNSEEMLDKINEMTDVKEFDLFLEQTAEQLCDFMGKQIDRIEHKLQEKFPKLRYIDLELL